MGIPDTVSPSARLAEPLLSYFLTDLKVMTNPVDRAAH